MGTKRLGWRTLEVNSLWELEVLIVVLCSLGSSALRIGDNTGSDDLDRLLSGTMSSSHLHVHLRDGSAKCRVSVFLVHVDDDGSCQVPQDDSVVPDRSSLLLENLTGVDNFTLNPPDLVLPLHVIPELGPRENGVACEYAHSVQLWVLILRSWEASSNNVELSNLPH